VFRHLAREQALQPDCRLAAVVMGLRSLPCWSVEVAMGLRGIGSRPLSVRHPDLSQQTPVPAAPGWQTHAQRCWLVYGFDQKWAGAFRDEAHYRETWKQHRETLMQECKQLASGNPRLPDD
jgi:hypothetical protein